MKYNSVQEALAARLKPIEMALDAPPGSLKPEDSEDEWSPEAREAAAEARRNSSHTSSEEQKQKTSVSALKTKLEGMPHIKLQAALKNPDVSPEIKKHIEKELDSRANRGTSKGFGE